MFEAHVTKFEGWRELGRTSRPIGSTIRRKALETGGRPPDPPGMEVRVVKLEEAVPRIEAGVGQLATRLDGIDVHLRAVEQSLAAVNAKLDVLTGQVVGKLPSWWQMPAVIGSTVALLTALYAGIQYLRAHGLL